MATTVNIQNLTLGLNGLVSGGSGLAPIQQPITLNQLIAASLANGSGAANKANQLYVTQATLAASDTLDVNLYSFGGAVDAGGNAYTMTVLKLLIFQNLGVSGAVVEADYIKLGGKGSTAAWTSYLGTNTDTVKVTSGGTHLIFNPGAAGYAVGSSTTNNILTLTAGANTGACKYNLIVVGATA